jgi:ketosteroid isomerase-like protein
MNQDVEAFFEKYEKALSDSDVSAMAAQYADVFMFGGPQGVQSIKKDDFLKVVPRRKEYFVSLGLIDSKVTSVDEISLDSKYSLVKTAWRMVFQKPTGLKEEIRTLATYILERKGDTQMIVFQIDHQDLTTRVKELGLVAPQ